MNGCAGCIVIALAVCYFVFGIYFLVTDYSVCGDMSPLWIYALVNIILVFFSSLFVHQPDGMALQKKLSHKQNSIAFSSNVVVNSFSLLSLVANAVYGGVVIYGGYTCSDMYSHGLWTWSLVTFYFQIVMLAVLCCMGLGTLCGLDVDAEEEVSVVDEEATVAECTPLHQDDYPVVVLSKDCV